MGRLPRGLRRCMSRSPCRTERLRFCRDIVMSAEEQRCEVAEVATPRIPHVPAGALDELVLDVVLVEQRARRDVVGVCDVLRSADGDPEELRALVDPRVPEQVGVVLHQVVASRLEPPELKSPRYANS